MKSKVIHTSTFPNNDMGRIQATEQLEAKTATFFEKHPDLTPEKITPCITSTRATEKHTSPHDPGETPVSSAPITQDVDCIFYTTQIFYKEESKYEMAGD